MNNELHPAFSHRKYIFRRKIFKLVGGAFHIFDEAGNLLLYSEQKGFRLREDMRIWADESKSQELLQIKTPQILDIGATYYVYDPLEQRKIGALRRKALKSIFRDEWSFLSPEDAELGKMTESSLLGALLSRWFNLVPQSYSILDPGGREIAIIRQHFNPFVLKYTMDILFPDPSIDPRLLVSAGILLCAIERRQQ